MIGERLAEARNRRGLTQAQLGKATGYRQTMISEVERGNRDLGIDGLLKIARALEVSIDYLSGLTETDWDVEFVTVHTEPAMASFDEASTVIPEEAAYPFRRKRLIKGEGIQPKHARVFRVTGGSMYPTLPDGSAVLVDYLRTRLREQCVYLVDSDESLLVKRARQCPPGTWWWCSDNPRAENRRLKHTDHVWGEVRWVGHALNDGLSQGV